MAWLTCLLAALLCITLVPPAALAEAPTPTKTPKPPKDSKSPPSPLPLVPFSFIIRGGVSLGSYEAGLNWAILRHMKGALDGHDGAVPVMRSVAGASAGGINSVTTALSWCLDDTKTEAMSRATHNLVRSLWIDVGIESLVPEESGLYDPDDALFSRQGIRAVEARLREVYNSPVFREGCRVPIALVVTRTRPLILDIDGRVKIRNERFVIPLVLESVEGGSVRFYNNVSARDDEHELGNVMFLSTEEEGGPVFINSVLSAVEATSAFPMAFGRVLLRSCLKDGNAKVAKATDRTDSRFCPKGFFPEDSLFVDGGVFDNMPLGSARVLAEHQDRESASLSLPFEYVYMDPDNRRPAQSEDSEAEPESVISYGVSAQLAFISGALHTAREYEMYNEVREGGWQDASARRLLTTTRYAPLTGDYLAHFGAFLDRSFREYDYYVGVYDGVFNVARYLCRRAEKLEDPACMRQGIQEVYRTLGLKDEPQAAWVFAHIALHEFGQMDICEGADWDWLPLRDSACGSKSVPPATAAEGNLRAVTLAILNGSTPGSVQKPDFAELVERLEPGFDKDAASKDLKTIFRMKGREPYAMFYPLATRMSLRLLEMEKEARRKKLHSGEDDYYPGLAGIVAFGVQGLVEDEKGFVLNRSTSRNWMVRLLPFELYKNVSNKGWGAAWETRLRMSELISANLRLSPYLYEGSEMGGIYLSSADLMLVYSESLASLGAGLDVTYTQRNYAGFQRMNLGVAGFVGILGDKVRLTVGRRAFATGKYPGELTYFQIGLTDMSGMLYWLGRTYY